MSDNNRKHRLFNIFSTNLRLFDPTIASEIFQCPMCGNTFSKAQLGELSEAHILPKSIGGRLTTLSCSECDREIGSKWNHDLLSFVKFLSNKEIGLFGQIVWKIGEDVLSKARIELRPLSERPVRRFTIHEGDDFLNEAPKRILRHMQETGQKQSEIKFETKTQFAHWELSYWHSFYLYAFHILGYQWVYSPIGQAMRQQINDEVHLYIDQEFLEPESFPIRHLETDDPYLSLRIIYINNKKAGLLFTFPLPVDKDNKVLLYLACPYPENDWEGLKTKRCDWGPNVGWKDNDHLIYGDTW